MNQSKCTECRSFISASGDKCSSCGNINNKVISAECGLKANTHGIARDKKNMPKTKGNNQTAEENDMALVLFPSSFTLNLGEKLTVWKRNSTMSSAYLGI